MTPLLLLFAMSLAGDLSAAPATSPAVRAARAREVEHLVGRLTSDSDEERDDARQALLELGEGALPALRTIAASSDTERSAAAIGVTIAILTDGLQQWLADQDAVSVTFLGPQAELGALRQLIAAAANLPDHFAFTPGEGGGLPGAQLQVDMKVTAANTERLLALQAELEPRGYRLYPPRTVVWASRADEGLRAEARRLIPAILAVVQQAIPPHYPSARIRRSSQACGAELTYRVEGTGIAGRFSVVDTRDGSPPIPSNQSRSPVLVRRFPQLALVAIAEYRVVADAGEPGQGALPRAFEQALAPLVRLERLAAGEVGPLDRPIGDGTAGK